MCLLSCPNQRPTESCRVDPASAASLPHEKALLIAGLLALTGGYLDAYTWIVHRAFANAQTANLVLLASPVTLLVIVLLLSELTATRKERSL
jgi:uncharacterized protein DUF1275